MLLMISLFIYLFIFCCHSLFVTNLICVTEHSCPLGSQSCGTDKSCDMAALAQPLKTNTRSKKRISQTCILCNYR